MGNPIAMRLWLMYTRSRDAISDAVGGEDQGSLTKFCPTRTGKAGVYREMTIVIRYSSGGHSFWVGAGSLLVYSSVMPPVIVHSTEDKKGIITHRA